MIYYYNRSSLIRHSLLADSCKGFRESTEAVEDEVEERREAEQGEAK